MQSLHLKQPILTGFVRVLENLESPGILLSPGQTDRQVVASGRKLNLRRDLRWVAKRTSKFPRKYTQVATKIF